MPDAAASAAAPPLPAPAPARHHWPADGCCANCGTTLLDQWCQHCGQRAADHHRSVRHLGLDLVESLTHADGRLWRTLRLLVLHPARLTRDYVAGRRAAEIPPLRLFLVSLLILFAVGSALTGRTLYFRVDTGALHAQSGLFGPAVLRLWEQRRMQLASAHPQELLRTMGEWAERFAILLLPLSALALRLLFLRRRDRGLYDHMIFAMHSLSFAILCWTAILLACIPLPQRMVGAVWLLLLALPVHLFMHMRRFYAIGVASTLLRMAGLLVLTMGVFVVLLTALTLLSLSLLPG